MARAGQVRHPRLSALMMLVAMSCLASFASSDYASDRAQCGDQVISLSTCLVYMQGNARAPTPDCCTSIQQVVEKNFKCLCILVKDRNEPELANFKVNVTLALALPSMCHVPANASDCPRLLNIPLNSTDARIFEQFGNATKGNSASDSGELDYVPEWYLTSTRTTGHSGSAASHNNGNSEGSASTSTKASGWRMETEARLWTASLLLLLPLLILGS